ncbi:hypothetical protein HPP92_015732 [Vanilla planifolia]|uniref:Uncharacterized protein n=1 Tax=Vanilla planifolia TaxID=51239 RepID=A0A835UVD8_VANPL|nr:hypothetical protein HPP92_015732 [Vanilla planifolia]
MARSVPVARDSGEEAERTAAGRRMPKLRSSLRGTSLTQMRSPRVRDRGSDGETLGPVRAAEGARHLRAGGSGAGCPTGAWGPGKRLVGSISRRWEAGPGAGGLSLLSRRAGPCWRKRGGPSSQLKVVLTAASFANAVYERLLYRRQMTRPRHLR